MHGTHIKKLEKNVIPDHGRSLNIHIGGKWDFRISQILIWLWMFCFRLFFIQSSKEINCEENTSK